MTASAVTPLLSNHQAPLRQQKGYSIIELSIALAIISTPRKAWAPITPSHHGSVSATRGKFCSLLSIDFF